MEHLEARLRAARAAEGRERPFITLAYAQSLDGSLAAQPGERLALSSPAALTATHRLRAMHDAILVGVDTVVADDPRLDVRLVEGGSPQPIILDSTARIPADSFLVQCRRPWLATTAAAHPERCANLERLGVGILTLPAGADGRVELGALVVELVRRGVASLMVEGGERVLASFLGARLADHLVLTVSPRIVGGLTLARSGLPRDISPRLCAWRALKVGEDLLIGGAIEAAAPAGSPGRMHDRA